MVGEWLHFSVGIGPVTMKCGRSGWGRVGVIQHHLVATLERRATSKGVVEIGLMELSSVKMFTDEEARLFFEICCELRVLGCRL